MLGHRSLNLADYLSIFKRRGWIVLIPLLILPIITVAFSYTVPPQYLSQTLVLIEGQRVAEGIVKPVLSGDLDSRLSSMKEQILSRSSIQPIIDRYSLYADKKMSMDDRIDTIRKNIDIKPIVSDTGHGSLPGFVISFKASDAHTAQQVCTEITTQFINENLRSRSDSAAGTVDFLRSQLSDAKRNLDEQDEKMAAFQQQYMGRLPSEEGTNSSMLSSLNTQLEAATQALSRMQQDKTLAESMLAQQLGAQNAAVSSVPGAPPVPVDSAALDELQKLQEDRTELLTHYTLDHPDVLALDRRIAEARRKAARPVTARGSGAAGGVSSRPESVAVQQLRAQVQSAQIGIEGKRREQAQIQSQIGNYQSRLMASPAVEQQYKQLTRDNQTAQAFYDDLRGKINTAEISNNLDKRQQGEQFRLMDAANLPEAPFSPKRSVFLFGGLAGGAIIGLLIIAVLEFRDTSMRNERDIWAFMQLPLLTTISLSDDVPRPNRRNWLQRIFLRKIRRSETDAPIAVPANG